MVFIATERVGARINTFKKKQCSARQLVNKRIVINSVPFTVQRFHPILPSRNYKFSHKRTNIHQLPSVSVLSKIHVYKRKTNSIKY